jgi:hypothetical protein
MNVTTETEEYPTLTSLVISPNLQALLEFDDRIRASNKSHKRPEEASSSPVQHGQYPSWGEQEVPTVSLPPPRRRKKSDGPTSPKTISECEGVSSSTGAIPEAGESEEVVFTIPEDIPEDTEAKDLRNPYLNSPPSPRYFHRRLNDSNETLETSRSVGWAKRQRSLSDQSQGGQLVSSCLAGGNIGLRPKERGESSFPGHRTPNSALSLFSQWIRATCGSDETVALAPPQAFSLFLSLSSSMSPLSASERYLISFPDRHLLRTIIFPRTTRINLEV